MSFDRREFLSRAALAAATLGLPASAVAEIRLRRGRSARPYLDLAVQCARWIDRSTQTTEHGLAWPADPLKPESVSTDFYNGMPGVVAFYAALHAASGDARWSERARGGADYLAHQMTRDPDDLGAGLYVGLAGLGYTFDTVARAGGGERYAAHARQAAALLARTARQADGGVEWSDVHDIVGGTAGTGLFLLEAGRAWNDPALVALAAKAGHRLIAAGVPAEGGRMWHMSDSRRVNFPNFSHGTAGVAYFLASLYRHTGERAFLDAALEGVRYLDAIATRRDGATLIFHNENGGQDRYYLSWCHGPTGTARLFYQLNQAAPDPRWTGWIDALTKGVMVSGIPEQRTTGYWNNISQCCGHIGVAQYCIDLARYHRTPTAGAFMKRLVDDTMRRAGRSDDTGLYWIQAENRTQPENLVAQTGFMQGAAGVGTFFLQLDALERGERWRFPQPDTPFAG